MRRFGDALTRFSVDHGWWVTLGMVVSTLLLATLAVLPTVAPETFPFLHPAAVDTDPENMLSSDEPARLMHHRIKEKFSISDAIVLGVVNEKHPDGVFNVDTLRKVHTLTEHAKSLESVVQPEVMSLSTVDDIENSSGGSLRFNWLMATPPKTQAEAQRVRERAMRIPLLYDTLFSADGKVVAIYLPLVDKHEAHNVMLTMQAKVDALEQGDDTFHFAGLPVAEDTFGVEMFKQMAISAPLAMLIIFLLMWFFFRKLLLIVAPMIVAMVAALSTMGLLVVTGHTIHIMSSMIPIFIMPIAVLNSIHIISDFFERYQETQDRKATIRHVMGDLMTPMLFTSLTTTAGFGSLALTPIPPVQTFGLFIATGVMLAWFWTITFIPAFIGLISPKRLENFGRSKEEEHTEGALGGLINRVTYHRAWSVLVVVVALGGLAGYGISKININDNPTRWFEADHPIRVADKVLNEHFGGTYDAYLTVQMPEASYAPAAYATQLRERIEALAKAVAGVLSSEIKPIFQARKADDAESHLDAVDAEIRAKRKTASQAQIAGWIAAGDFIEAQYAILEEAEEEAPKAAVAPDGADEAGPEAGPPAFDSAAFAGELQKGLSLHAAAVAAGYTTLQARISAAEKQAPKDAEAFRAAVVWKAKGIAERPAVSFIAQAAQFGEVFKDPEVLAWLETFETALRERGVGKTNSLAGVVKTVHRDLLSGEQKDFRVPGSRAMVAQTLEQFTSSHRKDDLWHFVTPDYRSSVVWLQLKSGDNQSMEGIIEKVNAWATSHPPPLGLELPIWTGLTYINVVWQTKMVSGMLSAFLGSFVVVLIMMVFLFRSLLWGILSMIPLTVTVGLCYGALGLVGKDYDMPVAVLSSLSLGLAVDYAIHFLARSRDLYSRLGSWKETRKAIFAEPARAILRNAVVVGVGFLPLVLSPLVPYQTVGLLIATILLLAGGATLIILPSMITKLERWLFPRPTASTKRVEATEIS